MEEEGYLDEVLTSLKFTDIHWCWLILTNIFTDIDSDWLIYSLILATPYISIIRDQSLLLSVAETWSPPPWWDLMERSGRQDYDCFQGGGVEGRSDSLNLTEEGIVGPYHFQSCQMSPFHIIELLFVCFLNMRATNCTSLMWYSWTVYLHGINDKRSIGLYWFNSNEMVRNMEI